MAKYLYLTLSLFLAFNAMQAQVVPDRPSPDMLVNDLANILSGGEEDMLEEKLQEYERKTSTQIAVVTVLTTDGMAIREYATTLANTWGVGTAERDNGIVFLASINDREVFIATGDGMQEVMPDETVQLIINQLVIPNFKREEFYKGIDKATDEIIRLLGDEYRSSGKDGDDTNDSGFSLSTVPKVLLGLLFMVPGIAFLFGVCFLCKKLSGGGGTTFTSNGYYNTGGGWGGITNVNYNQSSSSSYSSSSGGGGSSSRSGGSSSGGGSYSGGGGGGSYSSGSSSGSSGGSRGGGSFSGGGAGGKW